MIEFDAFQLRYPITGLGKVSRELLAQWTADGRSSQIRVYCPRSVDARALGLDLEQFDWVWVDLPEWKPDYLLRLMWGRSVSHLQRRRPLAATLFIPYLYNYGHLSANVVMIPDLLYRIIPFCDYANAHWWEVRQKFYLRRMVMRVEEWLVRKAREWIVYSNFVFQHASNVLQLPKAFVRVVPLGIPSVFFAPGNPDQDLALRQKLCLPERFVLYCGGYGFRKNVTLLTEACRRVHASESGFACVMVGGHITAPGVISCPHVSEAELTSLHRLSLFSVYPSQCEGFGLPPVEAAACGRPCLVADNSSMAEVQPIDELRVPTNDINAWTLAILRLWNDPEACSKASLECSKAASHFTWKQFSDGVWNVLNNSDFVHGVTS